MPPYRFHPGDVLDGHKILRSVGRGSFAETYVATVPPATEKVLIKIPKLDSKKYPRTENLGRLQEITEAANRDMKALHRLEGLTCVAQLRTAGACTIALDQNFEAPALYGVYDYINGSTLRDYLNERFPHSKKRFSGVPFAEDYLALARELTSALRDVHQRGVVHGDFWHDNILLAKSPRRLVLIDFGAAQFRRMEPLLGVGPTAFNNAFTPPDGIGTVAADLYQLGLVLLYMATGSVSTESPWPSQPQDRRLYQIKADVSARIKRANPGLLKENVGISDVIARCLRPVVDRVRSAGEVLLDLEMIDPPSPRREPDPGSIAADLGRRAEALRDPLFRVIAVRRLRRLSEAIEDMEDGTYDITGDHEELVTSFGNYFSRMGQRRGDTYLSLSIPEFWYPTNMGVDGRMLSLNQQAAIRGATIRRVFFFLKGEGTDDTVNRIVRAHLEVAARLRRQGIQTKARALSAEGWWEGFVICSEAERRMHFQTNEHFGLIVRSGRATALFPVYRETPDRAPEMLSLRFRSVEGNALKNFRFRFKECMRDATPLSDFARVMSC